MHNTHGMKRPKFTVAMIGMMLLGVMFALPVHAQEGVEESIVVDPQAAAVALLENALAALDEDAIAEATEEELAETVAHVLMNLEGIQHEDPEQAVPGAIQHFEYTTGLVAEDFADIDLTDTIDEPNYVDDVKAFFSVLIARNLLTAENIDASILEAVAGHIATAVDLLTVRTDVEADIDVGL